MMNTHSIGDDGKQTPYFSIILPIYNVAPYLEESIRSVLTQGYGDYELILVDDGSTDDSPAICRRFAAQDQRIRVIHKENGGLSSARNAGTQIAQGRYIWWVDSDDWIEPDALALLYDATCKENPDMVKFHFYRVGEQKQRIFCDAPKGCYTDKDALEQLLNKGFFRPGKFSLSAWGHIYKRDFLMRNHLQFQSERVIGSEDYLFNLSTLAAARSIRVMDEALYNYRLRPGSLTQRYRKELPEKYTELFRQLRAHFHRLGQWEKYRGRICNFYVWHLLHGTCFGNEYRITPDHTRAEGRKKVRQFLKIEELQYAVKHCDLSGFTKAQKIQVWAMGWQMEPLFYYLFVVKPRRRKEKNHEDQN